MKSGCSDRTEKDNQIINVVLHAFRNLAFIKDLPPNAFKSADRVEYSSLQVQFCSHLTQALSNLMVVIYSKSKMITIMKDTHILDVFTTLAANSANPAYNPFNAVLLEIYYLLLRGVKPQQLILDPEKVRTNMTPVLFSRASVRRLIIFSPSNRMSGLKAYSMSKLEVSSMNSARGRHDTAVLGLPSRSDL